MATENRNGISRKVAGGYASRVGASSRWMGKSINLENIPVDIIYETDIKYPTAIRID